MKKAHIYLHGAAWSVVALTLAQTGFAAPSYNWNGAGDGTTWSQGANWVGGIAPTPDSYQIFIGTGFPTVTPTPITIAASDSVNVSDQLFGPEWGETLNIYGTVSAGFGFAPVGAVGGPASTVNMYGNSAYHSGDSIFVGDMFWFGGGPNISINLYDNSTMTAKYLALGGQLNIFGGSVTISNALLLGPPTQGFWGGVSTDATRMVDVSGTGSLVIGGDATAQANDMIARGILEGNGYVGNVNIDTVSDPGYTVITAAVPEPGAVALLGVGVAGLCLRRRSR